MKLNKLSLALFLGLGAMATTSCESKLELTNPNQQTTGTYGYTSDDLEECVIAAYNHSRMEGTYARVGYGYDQMRGDEVWNCSQVWWLASDNFNFAVTDDMAMWVWRDWYYTITLLSERSHGGTSFYFAYAINQLPKSVSFSLVTAMDPTEKEPVEKMIKAGIDVTLNPSRNTVFFENIYGDNPNDRKQRVLAKADPFTIQQLEKAEAQVFHLGTLLSDDFSPEVVEFLSRKGRVSIDVQGYLREVRDEKVYPTDWKEKLDVLKHTYYLKVNETEMETITGLKDPREAAKLIHFWGVTEVIITLGSEGSLIYVDDTFHEIPAYPPIEVVDATGCGDTYSAGYLYKRLQGATPTEAGKLAAAMCTIKLEHNGPFNRNIEDAYKIIR